MYNKYLIPLIALLLISGTFLFSSLDTVPPLTIQPHNQLAQVSSSLTDGLVGWWKFDEGSGTIATDSSGNGNTGTLVNNPTWVEGKVGGGLSFDGVDDYVKAGKTSSLNNLNSLTYSAWIFPRTYGAGNSSSIFGKRYKMFGFTSVFSGKPYFFISTDNTNLSVYCNVTIPLNNWTHIAVTWDGIIGSGTHTNLYINGVSCALVGNSGAGVQINDSSRDLSVGANFNDVTGSFSNYFDGQIDDARIYNRQLSQNEISDLFNHINSSSAYTETITQTPDQDPEQSSVRNEIIITPPSENIQNVSNSKKYWVSPTGSASWTNCKGDIDPLNNYCPLSLANSNAVAGDTVYLKGGTYLLSGYGQGGIAPVNSGTSINNRIVYMASLGESPLIKGSGCYDCGWGIVLNRPNQYIKVDGINFLNLGRWVFIANYSSYNEIVNSSFRSETGNDVVSAFYMGDMCSGGSSLGCYTTNNWIHANTFSKAHRSEKDTLECYEGRDLFRIGGPPTPSMGGSQTGANNFNTVEDNYMEYAGHALFDNYGMYLVFRNNILHNEAWIPDYSNGKCWYPPMPNGKYSHRGMQISEDFGRPALYNLLEGNRIGYSSANPNNPGEANLAIAAPRNIVRYNFIYDGQQSGVFFKYQSNGRVGAGGMGSTENRVYNNTSYHNGWSYPYMQQYLNTYNGHTCSTCPGKLAGFTLQSGTLGNVLKNNIAYDNFSYSLTIPTMYPGNLYKGLDITVDGGKNPTDYLSMGTILSSNWTTSSGDPQFVNPSLSNPTSRYLPDLNLKSNSPAIDVGGYLTKTSSLGNNSRTLVVDDALYFQDGTWGSDIARMLGNFQADWIAVGSVNNVSQISGIDYSSNVITLKSPLTWKNGDSVWLYKDSKGKQVLYGTAPDIGAYEYPSGIQNPPPPPSVILGDFNNDNYINSLDISILFSNWNTQSTTCDLNKDGIVNSLDYVIVVKNWTV